MAVTKPQSPYAHAQYFAALDGFRGLLAVFVALYHTIWLSHTNSSAFFGNGVVIIDLFFVFSGFLMLTLYGDKIKDGASAKTFMVRRFARLYPLHLFMLLVFLTFALFRLWAHHVGLATLEEGEILPFMPGADESWRSLISHITMTHAMGGAGSLTFNPPSWTIGAEFYVYFIFIGFVFLMVGRRFGAVTTALIVAFVAMIYASLAWVKPNMDITHDLGFFRCMAGFFIGVLAARLFTLGPSKFILKHGSFLELALLIACVVFIVNSPGKAQFLIGPFLFAFVYLFAHDAGIISKFMSGRIFTYLAKISYSVYMIHVIISIFFAIFAERVLNGIWPDWNATGWGGDLLMLPYLAAVIIASHVTYHLIEVPGGKFVRRLFTPKPATLKAH